VQEQLSCLIQTGAGTAGSRVFVPRCLVLEVSYIHRCPQSLLLLIAATSMKLVFIAMQMPLFILVALNVPGLLE
jgi:hypothetical protein